MPFNSPENIVAEGTVFAFAHLLFYLVFSNVCLNNKKKFYN